MPFNVDHIRDDFPALDQLIYGNYLVYLDNAASTLKARSVIDAIKRHYKKETANIHRGAHFLSEQGTIRYEETRKSIVQFINAAGPQEVIFTKGTTESINLVASSFGRKFLKEGDEVLLSTLEHHSNIVPWQLLRDQVGIKIVEIPINDKGEILIEEYKKLLNPKVKLVSVTHISNALGTINPIKEMISLAHEAGARFLVDAAQSIAHEKVDVQDLDCDFLVFSSHKMFGPTGLGVLFGKEEILEAMPPYQGGGDMIDVVTFEKTTWNSLPHKFEAGTPHIAGVIAFKEAINYIEDLGMDNIIKQEHALLQYATQELLKIEGLRIIGTSEKKSAIISFVIDGLHHSDIGQILDKQGIAVRTGHHCTQPLMKRFGITGTVRASFAFYNTLHEVDQLVAGVKKAKAML